MGSGAAVGAVYGNNDDKASFETLTYAANRGMTFWDTADIYGKHLMAPPNSIYPDHNL